MIYMDFHTHLQDKRIISIDELLSNAKLENIKKIISCGTDEKDWGRLADIADKYYAVIPMFGLHPWKVDVASADWKRTLNYYLEKYDAHIGECGLDRIKNVDMDLQKEAFLYQLQLANEKDKVCVIHSAKIWGEMLCFIKSHADKKQKLMFHSFSASVEIVQELAKYNSWFSLSASILGKKDGYYKRLWEVIPHDKIILETDTPDILPRDGANKYSQNNLNEPANLPYIAATIAEKFGFSVEDFMEIITNNSKQALKSWMKIDL